MKRITNICQYFGAIMTSIFSTYSQGENRVTSTLMSVLRNLSIANFNKLMSDIIGETGTDLISIVNQPSGKRTKNDTIHTNPDAEISSNFFYYFETKIKANTINKRQLEGHLIKLGHKYSCDKKLIVLSNDTNLPTVVKEINMSNNSVFFISFDDLYEAINRLLNERNNLFSENEKYILSNFLIFLEEEGLINESIHTKVILVAANNAVSIYNEYHSYFCQPERKFHQASYIAFYKNNAIIKTVPKILAIYENVSFDDEEIDLLEPSFKDDGVNNEILKTRLKELKSKYKQKDHGGHNKLFILSKPDSDQTILLKQDIINDLKSKNNPDRRVAFVQGHRYLNIDLLKKATCTTDL